MQPAVTYARACDPCVICFVPHKACDCAADDNDWTCFIPTPLTSDRPRMSHPPRPRMRSLAPTSGLFRDWYIMTSPSVTISLFHPLESPGVHPQRLDREDELVIRVRNHAVRVEMSAQSYQSLSQGSNTYQLLLKTPSIPSCSHSPFVCWRCISSLIARAIGSLCG